MSLPLRPYRAVLIDVWRELQHRHVTRILLGIVAILLAFFAFGQKMTPETAELVLSLYNYFLFFATVLEGEALCNDKGWIYPECVEYSLHTVSHIANKYGLEFERLDWYHPRQTWCAMYHPAFNRKLFNGGSPSWNNFGAVSKEAAL